MRFVLVITAKVSDRASHLQKNLLKSLIELFINADHHL